MNISKEALLENLLSGINPRVSHALSTVLSGNDLSYDRENVNDQAHKNRFGLDNGEMEEMNAFIGDPDEHDMEEQDYGYYMVEGD